MSVLRRQTRRQVLKGAIAGAAGLALGAPALRLQASSQAASAPASTPANTLRLSDDLFVITLPGEANVVAQTGRDGVLLVDGVSAAGSKS